MREILFKAKRLDNGEWAEGYLDCDKSNNGEYKIIRYEKWFGEQNEFVMRIVPVDSETVCQFTGLTDKNGMKIFEGDILKIAKKFDGSGRYYFPPLEYPVNVSVKYDLCAYMWETIGKEKYYISFPDAW